jgi:antitoxin component YwqK of YwqJK toxin-antitoxin module
MIFTIGCVNQKTDIGYIEGDTIDCTIVGQTKLSCDERKVLLSTRYHKRKEKTGGTDSFLATNMVINRAGRVKSLANYKSGIPHGDKIEYYSNGIPKDYMFYYNGDLYYRLKFDQKGLVIDSSGKELVKVVNKGIFKSNFKDTAEFHFVNPVNSQCRLVIHLFNSEDSLVDSIGVKSENHAYKCYLDFKGKSISQIKLGYKVELPGLEGYIRNYYFSVDPYDEILED